MAVTDYLPARAIAHAQQLIGAVHECGPEATAGILKPLDRQGLYALSVTLAAMVPLDRSPAEMLTWIDPLPAVESAAAPAVLWRGERHWFLTCQRCGANSAGRRISDAVNKHERHCFVEGCTTELRRVA